MSTARVLLFVTVTAHDVGKAVTATRSRWPQVPQGVCEYKRVTYTVTNPLQRQCVHALHGEPGSRESRQLCSARSITLQKALSVLLGGRTAYALCCLDQALVAVRYCQRRRPYAG